MNFAQNKNTVLLIIAAIIVLGGGYWYFFMQGGEEGSLSSVTTPPAGAHFENLVGELGPITFDTSVLTDARFAELVDLHTAIIPETLGRVDPFAPIGR